MTVGKSTADLFAALAKLSHKTRRILAPYSKMQSRMLAIARIPSISGITSKALNMRKAPSLANTSRIISPQRPPTISPELGSTIEEVASVSAPSPEPLSYALKLRTPHASLIKEISNQPLWQAQFEAVKQAQARARFVATMSQSMAPMPTLEKHNQAKRALVPAAPLLPSAAAAAISHLPFTGPQAPSLNLSPIPLQQTATAQVSQQASSIVSSKLVEIGHQLSLGITPPPAISRVYSQLQGFSKSLARFPAVETATLRPQPQAQLGLTGLPIQPSPIKLQPPMQGATTSIEVHGAHQISGPIGKSTVSIAKPLTPEHRQGTPEQVPVGLESADQHSVQKVQVQANQKSPVSYPAIQLTRAIALNLTSRSSVKQLSSATVQASTTGSHSATPAQAQEPYTQNRERLVNALAEMETAQTKMQLTDRNPIPPPPPRVDLPRLQGQSFFSNRSTFTVQDSRDATRPVELGKNEPSVFQVSDAKSVLADWTAPEPDSLASSNELRLKIAKILEEEARRYLPEE